MALTGDRYVGSYRGHTVELVRYHWVKSLSLWIDGMRAGSGMGQWPWPTTTLTGTLEDNGITHSVVAKAVPRRVLWTTESVDVDGQSLPLTKTH